MRDPPQLRIHESYQTVERVGIAVPPGHEHSGEILLVLLRHAGRNLPEMRRPVNCS